jgi:hypothetical protein
VNTEGIYLDTASVIMTQPDMFNIGCTLIPDLQVSVNNAYFEEEIKTDLYFSPTGNDENDGLSPATPKRSFNKTLRTLTYTENNYLNIHLAEGEYTFDDPTEFPIALPPNTGIVGESAENTILNGRGWGNLISISNSKNNKVENLSLMNSSGNIYYEEGGVLEIGACFNSEFRNLRFPGDSFEWQAIRCTYSDNLTFDQISVTDFHTIYDIGAMFFWGCNNTSFNNILLDRIKADTPEGMEVIRLDGSGHKLTNFIISNNRSYEPAVMTCWARNHRKTRDVTNELFHTPLYMNNYESSINQNMFMPSSRDLSRNDSIPHTISNGLIFNNVCGSNSSFFHRTPLVAIATDFPRKPTTITNLTIANNRTTFRVLGIAGNIKMTNTILQNSYSPHELSIAKMEDGPNEQYIDIDFCNIYGGMDQVYLYDEYIQDLEYNFGENNIWDNPLFSEEGNINDPQYYQLSAESPCIDAGTPDTTGLGIPTTDILGNPRIWNDAIDMGCYEYGSMQDNEDEEEIPTPSLSLTSYPNPFVLGKSRNAVTIEFTLDSRTKSKPKVEIYNVRGQKVKTLDNIESLYGRASRIGALEDYNNDTRAENNKYTVLWNCTDERMRQVSAGVYFYRLVAEGETKAVRKMLVMK